jgi:hypothetical protein
VLVHSVNGKGRCIVIVTAYLMKKFNWSLFKTLEYMNSRRQDIDLRPSYVNQLSQLESRLFRDDSHKSTKWDDMREGTQGDTEEMTLKNT